MNAPALNPEGTWISFAITDVAVMNSTLAVVAWHFDQRRNISESSVTLQLKNDAISIINNRLRDPDADTQMNDGSVGAVATLANFEVLQNSLLV